MTLEEFKKAFRKERELFDDLYGNTVGNFKEMHNYVYIEFSPWDRVYEKSFADMENFEDEIAIIHNMVLNKDKFLKSTEEERKNWSCALMNYMKDTAGTLD